MKIHCFYHLYAKNHYVNIHNHLFAKILSNPFFDKAQFYFSVVGEDNWGERLIMPRYPAICKRYTDTGSEVPAFWLMQEYVDTIADDDYVFYFHCKGSSKNENATPAPTAQDTLLAQMGIRDWVDYLSFFLIEKIQEYTNYLDEYGTMCVYPTRHAFGNNCKAGSLGNFWWCKGSISKQVKNIDLKNNTNRHHFEVHLLQDLITKSNNNYRTGWYIHDGRLSIYYPEAMGLQDVINGYLNKNLLDLINIEMPLNINRPSVVIRVKSDNVNIKKELDVPQRFKNYIILNYNEVPPPALIYIIMDDKQVSQKYVDYWLDGFLKRFKTSPIENATTKCTIKFEQFLIEINPNKQ